MKTPTNKTPTSRSNRVGRFVVEKKGTDLFVNGNRILKPAGQPSVTRSELRAAVRKVASKR